MHLTRSRGVLAGLIQPTLLGDGQVRVDMGPPTLAAADVPTTLEPTRPDGSVVAQARLSRQLPPQQDLARECGRQLGFLARPGGGSGSGSFDAQTQILPETKAWA